MNAYQFTKYLNRPDLLDRSEIETLEQISAQYPYFTNAKVLLLKAYKHFGMEDKYAALLPLTAIQTPDRKLLYTLIHEYTPQEDEPFENILQQEELTTYTEDHAVETVTTIPLYESPPEITHDPEPLVEEAAPEPYTPVQEPEPVSYIREEDQTEEIIPATSTHREEAEKTDTEELATAETETSQTISVEEETVMDEQEIPVEEKLEAIVEEEIPLEEEIIEVPEAVVFVAEEVTVPEQIFETPVTLPVIEEAAEPVNNNAPQSEEDFFAWLSGIKEEPAETVSTPVAEKKEKEPVTEIPVLEKAAEKESPAINVGHDPVVEEEEKVTHKKEKSEIDLLLDKFILNNPSISRPKAEFYNAANKARESEEEDEELATETLAKIYTEQELFEKALMTYERLQVQHPEKAALYAKKIDEIKSLKKK